MRKMIVILMAVLAVINLSACGAGASGGNAAVPSLKFNNSEDPGKYFVADDSWTYEEIESNFAKLDVSESSRDKGFELVHYSARAVPVFGESWELTLFTVSTEQESKITGANFSFYQNNISDSTFVAYRDKIIDYYTSVYGEPTTYYQDSNAPIWSWGYGENVFALQDCRADSACMTLTFSPYL